MSVAYFEQKKEMRGMVFNGKGRMELQELPIPQCGPSQLQIKVQTCGICRTDLHIVTGELDRPNLPLIPGHQIVGKVTEVGSETSGFQIGDSVGVPWLGYTCGVCKYCKSGQENLCDEARFTGYHINGGFAEYTVADYRFCFHIPETFSPVYAAPLLCAGLIGYRAYSMIRSAEAIGLYGFGSAAHIVIQVARWEGKRVFAFVRPGDDKTREFAKKMGAVWADYTDEYPPEEMDASIIFAPAGELVPSALAAVAKGGTVVCGGIYMSDIPSFAYDLIWGERSIKTVANLTREDGEAFFKIAPLVPVQCEVTTFTLEQANEALIALKQGSFNGSGVIVVDQ